MLSVGTSMRYCFMDSVQNIVLYFYVYLFFGLFVCLAFLVLEIKYDPLFNLRNFINVNLL